VFASTTASSASFTVCTATAAPAARPCLEQRLRTHFADAQEARVCLLIGRPCTTVGRRHARLVRIGEVCAQTLFEQVAPRPRRWRCTR